MLYWIVPQIEATERISKQTNPTDCIQHNKERWKAIYNSYSGNICTDAQRHWGERMQRVFAVHYLVRTIKRNRERTYQTSKHKI